jgi:hypothetical protein
VFFLDVNVVMIFSPFITDSQHQLCAHPGGTDRLRRAPLVTRHDSLGLVSEFIDIMLIAAYDHGHGEGSMPEATSSSLLASRALKLAARGLWLVAVIRLAVQGGPRSAPGYNRPNRFEPCPQCGHKVRVEADGWGYCRRCGKEFDFN